MRSKVLRTSIFGHPGTAGVIRPARGEDAPALTRIMPLAFRAGSPEQAEYRDAGALRLMVASFDGPPARAAWFSFLVAERDGRVVGAVVFRYGMHSSKPLLLPAYPDVAILDTLAVDPMDRRSGVGRALLRRVEADMRGAGARVLGLQCPPEAIAFYERCGYRVEPREVACVTVFPRQGQQAFTISRAAEEPDARVAWRGLMGARPQCERYEHPARGEPAVMARGVIPGDKRRRADWPAPIGYRLVGAASGGSV